MKILYLLSIMAPLFAVESSSVETIVESALREFTTKQGVKVEKVARIRVVEQQTVELPNKPSPEKYALEKREVGSDQAWSFIKQIVPLNKDGDLGILVEIEKHGETNRSIRIGFENQMGDGGIILLITKSGTGFIVTEKTPYLPY